jgi:hypothetical protein
MEPAPPLPDTSVPVEADENQLLYPEGATSRPSKGYLVGVTLFTSDM